LSDLDPRKIDLIKLYEEHQCLIVDDLPEIRGMIKRIVTNTGMTRVDTAPNAEEAIRMCTENSYQMVLCDYNLGRSQDGQQLLEDLRQRQLIQPTSLFLMITGETSREMVLGAIELQPDDYITKPFTPKEFERRLDRVMIKHLALLPIKRLFGERKYQQALQVADDMIARGGRFTTEAERLRGRILFLLGQLHKSREHYERIVEEKPVPWAMLGLAETLVELGAYDQAEIILHKVLELDHRYVEAHDLLSRIHQQRTELEQAQAHTKMACDLSPKSVPRHRRLANLAELNDDVDTSLKSYKQAIRWGANSIHETGADYLNFARKTAEKARLQDGKIAKEDSAQALRLLRKAKEQYRDEPDIELQVALVEAEVLQTCGLRGADEAAEKACALFQSSQAGAGDTHLDYVRLLQDIGDEETAQQHLHALAAEFSGQEKFMRKIERLSSEPISASARANVARLTKSGIAAYQNRNYSDASRIFKEALSHFPNHVGLNLNLVQVLLERHESLLDANDVSQISRCFDRVRNISESDPQFARAEALRAQFNAAQRVQNEAAG